MRTNSYLPTHTHACCAALCFRKKDIFLIRVYMGSDGKVRVYAQDQVDEARVAGVCAAGPERKYSPPPSSLPPPAPANTPTPVPVPDVPTSPPSPRVAPDIAPPPPAPRAPVKPIFIGSVPSSAPAPSPSGAAAPCAAGRLGAISLLLLAAAALLS
jgi:hypothetical protein